MKLEDIEYVEWHDLYVNKKLLHREIAILLGTSIDYVYKYLKKFGINEEMKKNAYIPDERQHNLFIGSLLGDGSLNISNRSLNYLFKMAHNEDQLDYLQVKYEIIKNLCTRDKKIYKYVNKKFPERIPMYSINTKSLPIFHKYKQMSVFDLLDELNINSLFIWFLDDGNLQDRKHSGITCASFSIEEINYAINILKVKFDIESSIVHSNREKNGFQGLYISREATSRMMGFFKELEIYNDVYPCMSYKLIS